MRYTLFAGLCFAAVLALYVFLRFYQESPNERAGASKEHTMKTDDEWKKILTPEQYRVARKKGTERAFSGAYWNTKTPGAYACVCCGQELFASHTEVESG